MHCDAPGFRVRPAVSEYMYVKDLTNISRYDENNPGDRSLRSLLL
jgi:hypothetical protein